jgi:hypothetical protein
MRIRLRAGTAASSPVDTWVLVNGQIRHGITLQPGGPWMAARVPLSGGSPQGFVRIEVKTAIAGVARPAEAKTTDTSGVLMVGRPEYEYPPGVSR